tara:strand:+ start:8979 stop:9953 length:975 start_codon:yes stop_codon:yes gene_type:complete
MSSFSQEDNSINEDFLEVDPKIPGQNFCCLSFVSPDKVIKQKEVTFVTKFLEHLFNGDDQYTIDMREKMTKQEEKVSYEDVKKFYEDWKYSRNDKLEAEFYEQNDFRTTMRGLKIRGTYDTHKEASVRAQVLRRKDPSFNVFVGQVGSWLPWDPECDKIQEQEYQEQMLNDLVKKYKENMDDSNDMYDQLKEDQIKKAREELKEKKAKLAEQENEVVKESTPEDKQKIEELRDIIDESDKQYYDNMKKIQEQKKNAEITVTDVSDEKEEQSEITVTDNSEQINSQQEAIKEEIINGLESEDPWMKNKKSQDAEVESSEVQNAEA